jgi:2-hydroxy-6-oxonona-2,4-dienedioate hydrolase
MATIEVNGGTIAYELFGEGPPLIWNSGGRQGRSDNSYLLAGHFSDRYSVLIWDRRNSAGASDVALSEASSVMHADVDDLQDLVQKLGLGPACFGGGSAGCALSLLMAHRYPELVQTLITLKPATTDKSILGRIGEANWHCLADAVDREGMQGAIDTSTDAWVRNLTGDPMPLDRTRCWLEKTIHANPSNRERVLEMNPQSFVETARRWGDATASSAGVAGLTEEEIRGIPFPALVTAGSDDVHPPESADRLAGCLERSEFEGIMETDGPRPGSLYTLFQVLDEFLNRTLAN